MPVSENICPVCKNNNEIEAIVCSNCGAVLEDPFRDPGARTKSNISALTPENIKDWSIEDMAIPPDSGLAVYVEGNFNPSYISMKAEFVIGRKTGNTSGVSEALFDLSPLGGYGHGISRRHAVIRRTELGYDVLDLGSVNGTWLDNERLIPHRPYPLDNGSHLRLGSMRLFVLYRPSMENK